MTEPTPYGSDPYRTPALHPAYDTRVVSIPYDGQTKMRLAIASGMSSSRVRVDADARALVSVDAGDGPAPRLRVHGSEIRLAWSWSLVEWLKSVITRDHDVEIVLHPAVAWELDVRGGFSNLRCDFSAGSVTRVEVAGGCSNVEIDLPRPAQPVPIRIYGGANRLRLRRPAGVGVVVAVRGGATSLRLDDRSYDALGGSVRLETAGLAPDDPRYELQVSGGASDVDVERA